MCCKIKALTHREEIDSSVSRVDSGKKGEDETIFSMTYTGPYQTENVCSKPPSYPGSQETFAELVDADTWTLVGACGLVPEMQSIPVVFFY